MRPNENCSHKLCVDCYYQISYQGNNKCPLCRENIRSSERCQPDEYNYLFLYSCENDDGNEIELGITIDPNTHIYFSDDEVHMDSGSRASEEEVLTDSDTEDN
jgi:hypothetical protein